MKLIFCLVKVENYTLVLLNFKKSNKKIINRTGLEINKITTTNYVETEK